MARLEVPPPAAPGGRARIPRAPARRLVPILFTFLLLPSGQGHAQSTPRAQGGRATGWIEPEEVPVRADALRRRLEAAEPDASARATLERIERDLALLGPDLDAVLEQATAALARWTSFLGLQDQRSQLAATASPLAAWEETLVAEGNRVAQVLDEIARARRVWSETRQPTRNGRGGRRGGAACPGVARGARRRRGAPESLAGARPGAERAIGRPSRRRRRHARAGCGRRRSPSARTSSFATAPPLWHSEFGGRPAARAAARPGARFSLLRQEHARVRRARCTSARRAGCSWRRS